MSSKFYGKMWIATKQDLQDTILREHVLKHLEPTKNRAQAHELIGNLYARYIILCNNLSELYDQTLQVQRRALIEKLLISSQERLKEIQKDIRKIELSQFIFVDDALVELNLTPYDIEFLRPFYFPRRRSLECQQVIDKLMSKQEPEVIEEPKVRNKFIKPLTREELEAIRERKKLENIFGIIKRHEKARQCRIKGNDFKQFPEKLKSLEIPKVKEEPLMYDFNFKEDQAGFKKIQRTKFNRKTFYLPKIDMKNFDYYSPPEFRINKLGKKVLVPKEKKIVEDVVSEIDAEALIAAEREKLKLLQEEEDRKAPEQPELALAHLELTLSSLTLSMLVLSELLECYLSLLQTFSL